MLTFCIKPTSGLQSDLEKSLLKVLTVCWKYLKSCLEPRECNALWIVAIGRVEQKTQPNLARVKSVRNFEISTFSNFDLIWWNFCEVSLWTWWVRKNFSVAPMSMLKLSRCFSKIRGMQRTLNRGHRTRRTKNPQLLRNHGKKQAWLTFWHAHLYLSQF